ncbi:hypothetical protein [Streptomyces bobili]
MDPLNTQHGMPESEAAAEARRLIDDWAARPVRHHPTSFRDDTQPPAYGDTPPVKQDDKRIVPAWAAGIAVASIGVGAGSTGLGCAAWLLFKGLSLVSVPGLDRFALIVVAPFAGLAMVLTAAGAALAKATASSTTHVYEGPVVHITQIDNSSHQRGWFARTRNDIS